MYRSSSHTIEFTITDTETGDPVNLSTVERIVIVIFQAGKKVVDTFEYPTAAPRGAINLTTPLDGVCEVYLNTEDTKDALEKKLYAEVRVEIADANFTNGRAILIEGDLELEEVKDSLTRNE